MITALRAPPAFRYSSTCSKIRPTDSTVSAEYSRSGGIVFVVIGHCAGLGGVRLKVVATSKVGVAIERRVDVDVDSGLSVGDGGTVNDNGTGDVKMSVVGMFGVVSVAKTEVSARAVTCSVTDVLPYSGELQAERN